MVLLYYGMFVIRPDGNTTEFCRRFRECLLDEEIDILEEKEILFTLGDVKKYFFYQFPAYFDYMTSGESRCIFVGSNRADLDAKILQIKDNLRAEFGVDKQFLKSLIHSSQSGTEFFLQKEIFGEKYFSPEYVVGNDFDIKVPSLKSLPYLISRINESHLFNVVFNINRWELPFFEQVMSNQALDHTNWGISTSVLIEKDEYVYEKIFFICRDALKSIRQVSNLSIADLSSLSYSTGLGFVDFQMGDNVYDVTTKEEYLDKIEKKYSALFAPILFEDEFSSIQMDSPNFSLQETDFRGDIAWENGLKVFGGSSSYAQAGQFSFIYCYDEVENLELQ